MTVLPKFPEFVDFDEVGYEAFVKHLEPFDPYSDFNYVSLYSWNTQNNCQVSVHNNNLVISLQDYLQGNRVLSFIGHHDVVSTTSELLDYTHSNEHFANELMYVPETVVTSLAGHTGFEVVEDIDNHDYILSARQYIALEGKEFANKRKNLHKFERLYGARAKTMIVDLSDPIIQDEIKILSFEWAFMGTEGSINANTELEAIGRLLRSVELLGTKVKLRCLALYIDGKMEGFCIFEVHDNYAITHFGKANLAFNKAYEYMMVQTLRHIYTEHSVDVINNEQDLGIIGLRQSKQSQQPVGYLKKYCVGRQ